MKKQPFVTADLLKYESDFYLYKNNLFWYFHKWLFIQLAFIEKWEIFGINWKVRYIKIISM